MILYPAIDIRGGQAVRLLRGDYGRETVYDADPVAAAARWVKDGAELLHVVDLDGARSGQPQSLEAIRRIAASTDAPLQVGGGLRDASSVAATLEAGASRVVIGTAAVRNPAFLDEMLAAYRERIVVSVDARGGKVSLGGWLETSEVDAVEAIALLSERGVKRFLFTSIEVDGTMEGPLIAELNRVATATESALIASGGVGSLSDLETLAAEAVGNVDAVIVGRALYEGRFTVAEANAALARV